MKTNKKLLKEALEIVKPGLSNNDMIEQATSFCFKDGYVTTYNDEISICHPVDLELTGAISATELYNFINKVTTEEVEFEISNSELLLKAGRSRAGLLLKSEILLPVEEIGEIKKWKKLPEGFLKALDFAKGACSRDMSRPVLTCVHVNEGIIEGCDNYRMTKIELETPLKIKKFLIPAHVVSTVTHLRPIQIAEGDGWIHFKTKKDAIISCRLFEEEYVNTNTLWNITGEDIIFPKQMLEILEKAEIFAKREHSLDEFVTINLQKKKLIVRSESENGWFEEKAKVDYTGEELKFSITLYILKDILRKTNKAIISDNKLLFEADNWKY